ncbi:hypothetical protein K435DRAFT_854629 [Dendrothele bispora CBS 962.96]|uniref:Uncharacterized protein n=1 Tax=Dendrothele bispora (strain CBS 962.96) TaxID=1314807 RepID=A0A4S8MDB6_DENBC|nr:hypothetical protein K435DRAFT_854629 [Dendrothele bispora CBS 962.96]
MYFLSICTTSKILSALALSISILSKGSAAVPVLPSATNDTSSNTISHWNPSRDSRTTEKPPLSHPRITDKLMLFHGTLEWNTVLSIIKTGLKSSVHGGDFSPAAGSGNGEVEQTVYVTDSWVGAAHYMCNAGIFPFIQVVGLYEDEEDEEDEDWDEDDEGIDEEEIEQNLKDKKDSKNLEEIKSMYQKYDVISGPMSEPFSPLFEQYGFIKEKARKTLIPVIAYKNVDCSTIARNDNLKPDDYRQGQWGDPNYSKYVEKMGLKYMGKLPSSGAGKEVVLVYGIDPKKRKQEATDGSGTTQTKKPKTGS